MSNKYVKLTDVMQVLEEVAELKSFPLIQINTLFSEIIDRVERLEGDALDLQMGVDMASEGSESVTVELPAVESAVDVVDRLDRDDADMKAALAAMADVHEVEVSEGWWLPVDLNKVEDEVRNNYAIHSDTVLAIVGQLHMAREANDKSSGEFQALACAMSDVLWGGELAWEKTGVEEMIEEFRARAKESVSRETYDDLWGNARARAETVLQLEEDISGVQSDLVEVRDVLEPDSVGWKNVDGVILLLNEDKKKREDRVSKRIQKKGIKSMGATPETLGPQGNPGPCAGTQGGDAPTGPQGSTGATDMAIESCWKLAVDTLSKAIHETAIEKGWWPKEDDKEIVKVAKCNLPKALKGSLVEMLLNRNDGEMIALMHSELSEALEAVRAGSPPDDKLTEYPSTATELADVIIRIMDYCHKRELDLAGAVLAKIEFNKTRPYKHGGKAF